jgi:hypothetical protein
MVPLNAAWERARHDCCLSRQHVDHQRNSATLRDRSGQDRVATTVALGPLGPTSGACNVGLRRKPTFECPYQHPLASKSKLA